MNTTLVALVVFGCLVAAVVLGRTLRRLLPETEKNQTSRTRHACHHSCRGSRVGCAVLQGLAAGTRHHAIVNAVCAVGRAEPGIPTQVVGRALDGGCNATSRERRNHLSYRISRHSRRAATRGCASVV